MEQTQGDGDNQQGLQGKGGLFLGVIGTAAPLAALTFTPKAAGPSAGIAMVAPSPSESLPSVVAHSLAQATSVTSEAVSAVMAGKEASEAARSNAGKGRATIEGGREIVEDLRRSAVTPQDVSPPAPPRPPAPGHAIAIAVEPSIVIDELGVSISSDLRRDLRIEGNEVAQARAVGVTSEWLKGMREAGYRDTSMGELIGARAVGVNPAYVRELKAAGLRNISLSNLTAMRALGVSGRTVGDLRSAGHKNLTPARIIELSALRFQGFASPQSGAQRNAPLRQGRQEQLEVPVPREVPLPPEPSSGG